MIFLMSTPSPKYASQANRTADSAGLSLSCDIVKPHSGKIKVEAKEKEGSIFIIQLPV